MDNTFRNAVKFILVTTIVLLLSTAAFVAGFGSSYLLTGSGILPVWSAISPTATPSSAQEEEAGSADVPGPTPASEDEKTFQVFWEVWGLVQQNFYGELPSWEEVTYAAIHGMLRTLNDEYTAFIEPQAAAILAEDATGEFEGIGAFVNVDEDGKLELAAS
jgi:carboxyl-terminal processing protease